MKTIKVPKAPETPAAPVAPAAPAVPVLDYDDFFSNEDLELDDYLDTVAVSEPKNVASDPQDVAYPEAMDA